MDIKACLLTTAWLLPLVGFAVEIFGGYWSHHAPGGRFRSRLAAYLSVGCIGGGFLLSLTALVFGISDFDLPPARKAPPRRNPTSTSVAGFTNWPPSARFASPSTITSTA